MATGIDNSGLYAGRREAMGIIKAMAGQITSFDVFSGIGISAATAFASAAKDSYDFEKEFRKNMLEVATISTQVSGSMTDFMNQVMAITQEIPIKAPDAAKALYQIVSAGHDGVAGMNVLEVAAKSAVGGITDTVTAADAITTLLNAYKLNADDAEKVSDQLFTTARLGKTTFGELGQSIAQVAPIAAAYGVEMDQVLAAVATLTKSGTPTAQAMTQIRASIIGTSKVLGDGAFNSMTFQEALAEIANRAGGSEAKLRELIPEVEAVNGVLGMTGIKAQDAAEHLNAMNESAGATEAAFNKMQEDVGNQMILLSNNIQAALRPMGSAILKNVSEAAQMINKGFETGQIQSSMETLQKLLVAVAGAFVTYKSAAIGASTAEALHSAKVTISNNLKSLQSQITGEAALSKEKERIHLEAYTTSLEKSITEEQRAKLAKMDLKSGSQEYMKALSEQALQEKKNADNQVESLTKVVNKNKEKLSSAQENLEMSHQAVEAAKAELNAAIEANDSIGFEVAQTKMNAAAQREEAASVNVAAASKGVKASETRLVTVTTAAEAAATRVNTATTVADTAVTNIATTAKSRLKIATIALWGAMKANPLGAVLTAVSLAATVYMVFADKVKAAETAQSRLNKLNKAAAESIADEKAELMLLLSVAKNELVSKEDRTKAIKKLNDISPEYLGNLSLENIGTKEATTSIDAYTRAIGRNAKAKALMDEMNPLYRDQLKYEQELYDLQKKSNDLKANKLGFSDEQLYHANLEISGKIKNKTQQKAEVDKQIQDVLDMYHDELSNETKAKLIKVDIPVNIQIESEQANVAALLKKKEEINARINENKSNGVFVSALDQALLATVNKELTDTNNKLIALNKEAANPVGVNVQSIAKEIEAATTKVSTLKQELTDLRSGKTSAEAGKTVKEVIEGKVKDLKAAEDALSTLTGQTTKETDKLLKAQSDLSRSLLESELKLQAGRISAMEEGKAKRLRLAKQEYDEALKQINDNEKEQLSKPEVTKSQKIQISDNASSLRLVEQEKLLKANTDIEKDYAKQIESIQSEVDSRFRTQLENRLVEIENYYKTQLKIAKEAGEVEEGEFIQMLLKKKTAETEYAKKENALSNLEFNEKTEVGQLENRSSGVYFVEEAEREKTEILRKYALERIALLESMGDEQSLKDAQLLQNTIDGYDKALSKPKTKSVNKMVDEKAIIALQKHFVKLGDAEDVAKEKAEKFAEGFKGKMQMVSDVAGILKESFGGISDELDMALDAVGNIAQGFAEGGLVGGISAAAGQVLSMVGNLLTAKKEIDKSMVEGYENYMDAINDLIDTQVALLDKLGGMAFGQNVINTTKDIAKSIAASRTLLTEAMSAGSGMFSHSDGYKANKMLAGYKSELREIGIYTTDLNRMSNEQLASLKKLPEVYARLPEDLRKYIDAIAEGIDKTEEFKQQVQDTILGLDFTSMADMIVDSLTDPSIDNALGDFEKNIDKTLASIIKNMLRRNILLTPLEKMMSDLYKSMETGKKDANGNPVYELTSGAAKSFKDNVLGLGKQFQDAWKVLEESFGSEGIDLMPKEEATRQAAAKGFAAMSQDSANALDGKFTSQLIFLDKTLVEVTGIREQMSFIRDLQVKGWEDVKAIKLLSEKVADNTLKVADISGKIEELSSQIATNTKKAANGIQNMNDKGLIMRAR